MDDFRTLSPEARALAEYMSQLSEEGWSAGWMTGLEHALFRAVVEGPFRYGHLDVTEEHVAELKRLSEAAGGWVVWDVGAAGDDVPRLVPLGAFRREYDADVAWSTREEAERRLRMLAASRPKGHA